MPLVKYTSRTEDLHLESAADVDEAIQAIVDSNKNVADEFIENMRQRGFIVIPGSVEFSLHSESSVLMGIKNVKFYVMISCYLDCEDTEDSEGV